MKCTESGLVTLRGSICEESGYMGKSRQVHLPAGGMTARAQGREMAHARVLHLPVTTVMPRAEKVTRLNAKNALRAQLIFDPILIVIVVCVSNTAKAILFLGE